MRNIKIDGHLKRAFEDPLRYRCQPSPQNDTSYRGEEGIDRVFFYTAAPQGVIVFQAFIKRPDARRLAKLKSWPGLWNSPPPRHRNGPFSTCCSSA